VQGFKGAARFVTENYGDSPLAKRFGVTRYPAIFVNDVLVATPKDFGFYGKGEGEGGGRYAPFVRNAANQQRFRDDLERVIDLLLGGRGEDAKSLAAAADSPAISALPAAPLVDLDGKPVSREELRGRVVFVEFWATWCPPCRGTLAWLAALQRQYGDRVAVVAIAIDSDLADVRRIAAGFPGALRWTMASPEVGRAFGDVSAVPTLFMFDGQGRTAGAFYGATPTLHADAEAKLAAVLAR
jgi:cytochrome c biogenesis protein CcmG, thiol:disulfide interchange protein DsbE